MAGDANVLDAPPIPVATVEESKPRRGVQGPTLKSFAVTFFAVVVLAAFLSPMLRTVTIALKSTEQITASNSPLWPADPATFTVEGRAYDVYQVPVDGVIRDLALV